MAEGEKALAAPTELSAAAEALTNRYTLLAETQVSLTLTRAQVMPEHS